MIFRRRAVLALLTALFALALPAVASAATTYTVDSLGDEPDEDFGVGECETTLGTCTLRAAIQVSNFAIGTKDKIDFDASLFKGRPGDTIVLESALPNIVDPILIDGDGVLDSRCLNETFSIRGPCVEVSGPNASTPALVVDNADGVTIEGLSVTGSRTAINVVNSSSSFEAHGDWLGVKLDGTAAGNTTGIFLDPDSNIATIGGTAAADRNVFGNNGAEGLDVQGASSTQVSGNYFGVKPDGVTAAANGKDIEVTDSTAGGGFDATETEIGAAIGEAARSTFACDGGCNVISGATTTGIDLNGDGALAEEAPASGPTIVHGNYVGLDEAGTGAVANGSFGILVGGADKALIGGPNYEENANFIAGGSFGIYHENGDDFEAESNQIGIGPVNAATTAPPSEVGIFVFELVAPAEPATIAANAVRMAGGVAIEARFSTAAIVENLIALADTGILTTGSGVSGSLIAENMIGSVTGNGILIKSDANEVIGNLVLSSGAAGIRVQHAGTPPLASPTTGNLVGGDLPSEENEISVSGGPAIEIVDFEATANEVGRNRGILNGGPFIDLVATNPGIEPNGPNEGIEPPSFSALSESASGSDAEEGALIRVFRKAKAEPGEIESFLGETVADAEGNWKLDFGAPLPGGTILAATQTSKGATSELATATTPGGGGGGSGGNGGGGGGGNGGGGIVVCSSVKAPCPGGPDTVAPQTTILKGPKAKIGKTTATFKFSSSEKGSTFRCKLDRKPYRVCKSPKTYKNLKPGNHVFKVRAVDAAGNIDPTPARRRFRVLAED